ncbi:anti-sigma factor [bacterium]|nr:MAG: anti-sigma factor [bacterium]
MIDIKAYIESGILEDYALGTISEQEMAEVNCLASTYLEINSEIQKIQLSLGIFAELGAIEPAPEMREKIWNQVKSIGKENTISLANTARASESTNNKKIRLYYSLTAILAIVAFVTTYWAINTNNELTEKQSELADLHVANENISRDFSELREIVENNNKIYEMPNTSIVKLSGMPDKSPKSMAYAVWDKSTGDVYLDVKNLPDNPGGMQYQLWTISDKGVPISVGVFDQNNQKQIMKIGKADTSVMFAVTLEKTGGVQNPTMNEMYIAGKVTS